MSKSSKEEGPSRQASSRLSDSNCGLRVNGFLTPGSALSGIKVIKDARELALC